MSVIPVTTSYFIALTNSIENTFQSVLDKNKLSTFTSREHRKYVHLNTKFLPILCLSFKYKYCFFREC